MKSGAPALPDLADFVGPALDADHSVQDAAGGSVIQVALEGKRVDVMAVNQLEGRLDTAVTEGRAPRGDGEVLLGRETLRQIGAEIGDLVTAIVGGRAARLRVVGVGVFPPFGDVGQFGYGALMTFGQLKELVPAARQNVFLLKFTPDASLEREYAHVRNALEPLPTRLPQRPSDLDNLASIGGLRDALIAIWALFADSLGIDVNPVTPWSGIAVLVPVALLLAVVVAVVPAFLAARARPADTLHTQ